MDSWLTFFGIWMSEGWITCSPDKTYRLAINQQNKK